MSDEMSKLTHLLGHLDTKAKDKHELAEKLKDSYSLEWEPVKTAAYAYEDIAKFIRDTYFTEGGG